MNILILSAAYCYANMAALDEQAKKVIEQASADTKVTANIKIVPGSTAIYGGVIPKKVMNELMKKFSQSETGPAIVINGEIVYYGVPKIEDMKVILTKYTDIMQDKGQEK